MLYGTSALQYSKNPSLAKLRLTFARRSFIGYSNANYALSEIRNPVRTIKLAVPLAMISITLVYMMVNIAYYAVVDKQEILGSGRIIAALFFGKLWGSWTERVCPLTFAKT